METDPDTVVNYSDIRESLDLVLSDELTGDRQKDRILNSLDDAIGNHAEQLWHFDDMGGPDREKFMAATSYDKDNGTIDVWATGMDIDVTPNVMAMAADGPGIEVVTDVLPEPVDAMFDVRPSSPVRMRFTIDSIGRHEVHGHYDEEE